MNQGIAIDTISQKLLDITKQLNTCSIKNQSNVKTFRKNNIMNKNRFNEAIKDTQKKKSNDWINECGNIC